HHRLLRRGVEEVIVEADQSWNHRVAGEREDLGAGRDLGARGGADTLGSIANEGDGLIRFRLAPRALDHPNMRESDGSSRHRDERLDLGAKIRWRLGGRVWGDDDETAEHGERKSDRHSLRACEGESGGGSTSLQVGSAGARWPGLPPLELIPRRS